MPMAHFSCSAVVMQQGDKNGPPTFQQLIMIIFADMIRIFVYCYQDDIFVFSMTWEDHQAHLGCVFQRLREEGLFLSRNPAKVDIYSARTDCLGFIVTDKGIHVDLSKIDKISAFPIVMEWIICRYMHGNMRGKSVKSIKIRGKIRGSHGSCICGYKDQKSVSTDTRIRKVYPQIYPYGYGYKWIQIYLYPCHCLMTKQSVAPK
jgi:hypothetical protein